jgi:hypothetical protein
VVAVTPQTHHKMLIRNDRCRIVPGGSGAVWKL